MVSETAPSPTVRPDVEGERTCLRVALAPILVLVLAHLAFEVTSFGLAKLDESVAAHLTSSAAWDAERTLAEANTRLAWSSGVLLFFVVILAMIAVSVWVLRWVLRDRSYRTLVSFGAVSTVASLSFFAYSESTGNSLSGIFHFTYDSLTKCGRFEAPGLFAIKATVTSINVLVAVVPVLALMAGCAILAPAPDGSAELDHLDVQMRRLKIVMNVGSAMMASGILHMLVWLRWPSSLVDEPALAMEIVGLAAATSTYWGVAFTLVIVAWYVPSVWVLRQRASVALRSADDVDADKWFVRHGFALTPTRQLPQVAAMLAPLLAGPIGSALVGLSNSPG